MNLDDIDPGIAEALKAKHKFLFVFSEPAIEFYLGMKRVIEDSLEFDARLSQFLDISASDWKIYNDKTQPIEKIIEAEKKIMPPMSRFLRQKKYIDLSVLFHFSIFIEGALNKDHIIKRHSSKKVDKLDLGLRFGGTSSTWVSLVSAASNYSRHFGEWDALLKDAVSQGGSIESIASNIKLQNNQAYQSISKLIELPTVSSILKDKNADLADLVVSDLQLKDFTLSYRRVECWLLRLERLWREEVRKKS